MTNIWLFMFRGGGVDEKPPVYSYQYNEYEGGTEDDRLEFKLRCPTVKSFR